MTRRLLPAAAAAGLLSLVLGGLVAAHANLVTSSPGSGEVLAESPTEVRLVFSEPVDPAYAGFDLLDADGNPIAAGVGSVDPTDAHVLVSAIPHLEDGLYTINWHALSASDGHVTQGVVSFGVGDVALPPPPADSGVGSLHLGQSPPIAVLDALSRTLSYGGAMLAFGLPLIGVAVLWPAVGGRPRRIGTLAVAGLACAAAGALGSLVVGSSALTGAAGMNPLEYAFATQTGLLLAIRALGAGVGAIVVTVLLRRGQIGNGSVVAGVVGAGCLALIALGSHAAASEAIGPVVADVVHLGAGAIWLSGLAGLVLLSRAKLGPTNAKVMQTAVPRFSALALASIGLVAASGLYAAWLQVGSLDALATAYGQLLVVKIVVVGAALSLGAINYFDAGRARPLLGGLRRRLVVELSLAAVVILLTANLTGGSPPGQASVVSVPAAGGTQDLGLSFQPGDPGPNRALVSAPPPGIHIGTVELQLTRLDEGTGTNRIPLQDDPTAPHGSRFVADGILLPAGSSWEATAVVRDTSGIETGRQRFPFEMTPGGLAVESGFTPNLGLLVGIGLLLGAVVGLAYWTGGGSLPRTARETGRPALLIGGIVGLVLGAAILLAGPVT